MTKIQILKRVEKSTDSEAGSGGATTPYG